MRLEGASITSITRGASVGSDRFKLLRENLGREVGQYWEDTAQTIPARLAQWKWLLGQREGADH